MKIDQIIRLDIGKNIRVWQVTGIYLGSESEEDTIGLKCLDRKMGVIKELLVPRHIIEVILCNDVNQKNISAMKKEFCWFDLYTFRGSEIDYTTTYPDGSPAVPMNCVKVPCGAKVKVYESLSTGQRHACIGGRAVPEDAKYGLHCGSDFDSDNYQRIGEFNAQVARPLGEKA